MNNLNKFNKYYDKNELKLYQNGGRDNKYSWAGIETDMKLYIPQLQHAGESENIWPIITKSWKENYTLGIKSINNSTINFLFVPNNIYKIDVPILGRGTFTSVYQLKNENDKSDLTKYVLRIYTRDLHISNKHMMYNEKLVNEYQKYSKYLLKIYYYGGLTIIDDHFDYVKSNKNSNLDKYEFKPNTKKIYNFDYVITKIYNTPSFDKYGYAIGLSNLQKFAFLYNNVVLLYELHQNNSFHADFKIGNVGWEDGNTMNVVLIDYDIETIQILDKLNQDIITNSQGYITSIRYPSTYIPEFFKDGDGIKSIPAKQLLKYSVGGLHNIIKVLNIEFTSTEIDLPTNLVESQKISKLYSSDLGKSLNLLNKDYDSIPEYSEILAILGWLYLNKKIKE